MAPMTIFCRVSLVWKLFAAPGGDAAFFAELDHRHPSRRRTADSIDIERALDAAERNRDGRQAASWEHRAVVEAEQEFPNVPSAAWRRAGERFDDFTATGPPGRRITRKLSDRARALAVAAERPEPPARPGLVKRLFEWVRERVERLIGRLRPSKAAQRRDRLPAGDVQPPRAAAAEREPADRRHEQVLTEWQAQPWQLRQITARPRREPPDPPDRHDLAAARYELAGVVSTAMMTELDRLMPQRRPASPPADRARTPPAPAPGRRDQLHVERPAERRRDLPVYGPDTRPKPTPARPAARRDRGHEPSR